MGCKANNVGERRNFMIELPKIFPAGAGEKVQFLAHDFNDNTVRFVLRYPGILDPDIMQKAAAALVNSVDVLHASFIPGNVGAYWKVHADIDGDAFFTLVETDKDPVDLAQQAALIPILPSDQAQLHCTLVCGKEESAVTLNISHLCVDGGDGKYLLYKLAEAYELIRKTGGTKGLEVKNGNRATSQMYEELTPKDYLALIKMPISGEKTGFPFPEEDSGEPRIVTCSISSSVMKAARGRAKEVNATVNDILLTACYRAYAHISESAADEAVSVMSMMDLRRHCKGGESDGLCNMSGFLPTTLKDGVRGDFIEVLEEIASQTREAKENPLAGMDGMPLIHTAVMTTPLRLLLEVMEKVYGSLSIGLTNLGNFSCEPLTMDGLYPSGGLFGGPLKKKPAMQVSAASFDGTAVLCCISECGEEDAALLQRMLNLMAQEVIEFAQ